MDIRISKKNGSGITVEIGTPTSKAPLKMELSNEQAAALGKLNTLNVFDVRAAARTMSIDDLLSATQMLSLAAKMDSFEFSVQK
jgi:hypothetical protein